ncbi:potassium channel family protein [Erythrobacter sp.]|uniref:potassium channel family protein n=1 Tax=Erythrobacter sp. TaxID=1042 RepID=UPI001425E2C0|nr:potassium channel family protein [Erythrobacter sp.]QIQ87856.1 MAG: potassium channel family protein [Erythrobacter sp.]
MTLRSRAYNELFASARTDGKLTLTNRLVVLAILASVAVAIVGTERAFASENRSAILWAEFGFGVLFLAEYCARLWAVAERPGPESDWAKRSEWARSFFALIDLVVVVITLIPFILAGAPILRLLRLFRLAALLKFGKFSMALKALGSAIVDRRYDLYVTGALALVLLLGGATALYWAEGKVQPEAFGSIPRAMWWSIITLTTVGYGDVSPVTPLGKVLAALVAMGGIGLVAMPTGIIAAAFSDAMQAYREEEARGKDGAMP